MATYITIETDKRIAYQIDGGEKNVMFANVEDDGYPEPTGTITITQNGTGIDVKDYAEADVNVPGGGYPEPTGTITITKNGSGIDVKDYAEADVNVPSSGIILPDGCEIGVFTPTEDENTHTVTHSLGEIPKFAFCLAVLNRSWTDISGSTILTAFLGADPLTGEFDASAISGHKQDNIVISNANHELYNTTSSDTTYPASMTSNSVTFVTGRYYNGKFKSGEHYLYILTK